MFWKNTTLCDRLEGELEGLQNDSPLCEVADAEDRLPQDLRAHSNQCARCRGSLQVFLTSRRLLADFPREHGQAPAWFSKKVMAAIGEPSSRTSGEWLAIPRFASRLALISALALLVAGSWLYEAPWRPSKNVKLSASSEYLFDGPAATADRDDGLFGSAER